MTSSHTPEQVQYTVETAAREWKSLVSQGQESPAL